MKNIFKVTATFLMAGICLSGVSASAHGTDDHGTDDHGDKMTQTFDYKNFDQINVGGVFEVDVSVGAAFAITISGSEKDMEDLDVYEKDGVLYLKTEKNNRSKKNNNREEVNVRVSLPSLSALKVSGVASGDITGVDADDFDLRVSGVAEVEIEGRCNSLKARVSGVGELDARNFKCKSADVALTGVGEMSVFASESVDVTASGVGSVDVYGKPKKVSKSKALFSEINIK